MDLLHREWGYMLYTPLSVQSTLLEGFTANGSLRYDRPPNIPFFPLIQSAVIVRIADTTTIQHTPRMLTDGAQAQRRR